MKKDQEADRRAQAAKLFRQIEEEGLPKTSLYWRLLGESRR